MIGRWSCTDASVRESEYGERIPARIFSNLESPPHGRTGTILKVPEATAKQAQTSSHHHMCVRECVDNTHTQVSSQTQGFRFRV
jgi:hypothetical protein